MMRFVLFAAFVALAMPGWAKSDDLLRVKAAGDVVTTMDALEAAVTAAGATVFARVDHAGGAAKVDLELAPSQLLIFGNPKLGTPAMQDDPMAGLFLPLKVLVYQDGSGPIRARMLCPSVSPAHLSSSQDIWHPLKYRQGFRTSR
ncbi:MAG: DUF302 domain-containing protein, partial [Pseudomonadota bacterium]